MARLSTRWARSGPARPAPRDRRRARARGRPDRSRVARRAAGRIRPDPPRRPRARARCRLRRREPRAGRCSRRRAPRETPALPRPLARSPGDRAAKAPRERRHRPRDTRSRSPPAPARARTGAGRAPPSLRPRAPAGQTRHREQDRVEPPLAQTPQPRVHVATQVLELELRPQRVNQRAAPEARGADTGAGPELRKARPARDEHVARVGALQDRHERETGGQRRRHVLQRVHGEVHLSRQQRLFDLLQEGALAADGLEPLVLEPVAGGRDLVERRGVPERREPFLDVARLPERERAAARPDPQRAHRSKSRRTRPTSSACPLPASSLSLTVGACSSLLTIAEVAASSALSCSGVSGPSR